MGLWGFRFPNTNLHELNLDWILSRISVIDQTKEEVETLAADLPAYTEAAEAAATAANEASETASTVLESVESAATRAANSASSASDSALRAINSTLSAESYKNSAQSASTSANSAAESARNDAEAAEDSATAAGTSATAAADSATAADTSEANALAYMQRAEAAASTTGFTGLAATINNQTSATMTVGEGDYIIAYDADDDDSSSGLFIIRITGSSTFNGKLITYTGTTGIMLTYDTGVLRIRNIIGGTVRALLLGFTTG